MKNHRIKKYFYILCIDFLHVYLSLARRRQFARMESESEVDDRFATAAGAESEEGSEEEEDDDMEAPKKRKMDNSSSRKRLDSEMQEKKKKPGVIYLSRSLIVSAP